MNSPRNDSTSHGSCDPWRQCGRSPLGQAPALSAPCIPNTSEQISCENPAGKRTKKQAHESRMQRIRERMKVHEKISRRTSTQWIRLCASTVKGMPSRHLPQTTQHKHLAWYGLPVALRIRSTIGFMHTEHFSSVSCGRDNKSALQSPASRPITKITKCVLTALPCSSRRSAALNQLCRTLCLAAACLKHVNMK